MQIDAWQVHDTGLVAAPGPFRRLPGAVRHHRGEGEPWPDRLILEIADAGLVVHGVGSWSLDDVGLQVVSPGPPATFILRLPGAAHLLAAASGPSTDALLAALSH